MFPRSLTGKLSIVFAGFGLGVILLAGAFGVWNATNEFNRKEFRREDLPRLTLGLAEYYEENEESWGHHVEDLPIPPYALLLDKDHLPVLSQRNPLFRKQGWLRRGLGEEAIIKDGKIVGFLQVMNPPAARNIEDIAGTARSPISWLGFGAILLAAGVSGNLVSRRMTRPLQELTEATKAVAAGDLDYRVSVRSQDEFGILAQAFNSMNEKLRASQQRQRQMTQDIVHDLAQPIVVIRGLAESMQEGVVPKSEANLQVIQQEADRLDALTRNLHFLEQADSDRLHLNQELVAPNEILTRFHATFLEPARQAGIELQVTDVSDLPMVYVDSERFMQVLSNLMANVFQHGSSADTLTMDAVALGQEVRFTLTDNGPGAPEIDLDRIFDRFYRADKSRSPHGGGSGIGLAIVRSLIEAQGGKVWAEAARPQGLRIVVSLPTGQAVEFPHNEDGTVSSGV